MDVIREARGKGWAARKMVLVLVFGVGIVALLLWRAGPALPSVPSDSILVDTVRRGEMIRQVSGPGVLVALDTRLIPSILPKAQVERVLIHPGTAVTSDTVLMRLNNPLILQQYDEARLRLEVASAELQALKNRLNDSLLNQESQVAAAQSSYEAARLQAEREGRLVHLVSELQYRKSVLMEQQLKTQLDVEMKRLDAMPELITSELQAKTAQISLLQRQLDLQQKLADSLDVTAGIEGIVQEIRVKEGQGVDQGEILALVGRQDELKAEIRIIESQAREVAAGQTVVIQVGNSRESGTVARIDPSVINGTVLVEVAFSGKPPGGARANLRVNATIEIERLEDVLYVNKPAQVQENAQVKLFRVSDGGVATLTTVQLGRTSSNVVEIVDGLVEGDRIVLSDITDLAAAEQFELR